MPNKFSDDVGYDYTSAILLRQEEEQKRIANDYIKRYGLDQPKSETPQQPMVKPKKKPNMVKDVGLGVVGGLRDAANDILGLLYSKDSSFGIEIETPDQPKGDKQGFFQTLVNLPKVKFNAKKFDFFGKPVANLPDVKTETPVGNLTRGVTDFLTLFLPSTGITKTAKVPEAINEASKLAKAGSLVGKVLSNPKTGQYISSMLAGAMADFAHDPYEARLSNMVQEVPGLKNPISEFLAADPNDTATTSRIKNVLEGMGMGMITDGLLSGLKWVKARRLIKAKGGEEALKLTDEVIESTNKELQQLAEDAQKGLVENVEEKSAEIMGKAEERLSSLDSFDVSKEARTLRDTPLSNNERSASEWLDSLFENKPQEFAESLAKGDSERLLKDLNEDVLVKTADNLEMGDAVQIKGKNYIVSDISDSALIGLKNDAGTEMKVGRDAITGILSNQKGAALFHPTLGGAVLGGTSGLFVDYNQDGVVDINDMVIGTLIGGSAGYGLNKLMKYVDSKKAFSELQQGKIEQLAATEEKLTKALENTSLDDATRSKFEQNLKTIKTLKEEIGKVKSFDEVKANIKEPETVKVVSRKTARPIVQVKPENLNKFVAKLSSNIEEAAKDVDVDFDSIDSEEAIRDLYDSMEGMFPDELKKTVKGWDITKQLADDIGISVDNVNKTFKDISDFHGKALAARLTLKASENKLTDMITNVLKNGETGAKEILQIRKQLSLHVGLQSEVSSMKSELGRALNSLKILSETDRVLDAKQLEEVLERFGGRERNMAALENFLKLKPGHQRNNYIRALSKNPLMSFTMEVFYGALLSNPGTWAINALSGAFTTLNAVGETALASTLGKNIHKGEAMTMVEGARQSVKDAFVLASRAFKEGQPIMDATTKIGEVTNYFSGALVDPSTKVGGWLENYVPGFRNVIAKGLDVFGSAFRFGEKVLMSSDEFWKVINHRMSLHSQAFRDGYDIAIKEGLQGETFNKRIAEFVNESVSAPSQEMLDKALQFAREQTFTNRLESDEHLFSSMGKGVQEVLNHYEGTRFIVPFVKTSTNITTYIAERTPILNMMSKKMWDIHKYGTPVEKEMLRGQLALGSLLLMTGGMLASSDIITGGGFRGRTSGKEAGGWQPYSFKVGDKYIQYNRLDPLGGFLGIAADVHDIMAGYDDETKRDKAAWIGITAIFQNLLSKQYLGSVSQVIDALSNPDTRNTETIINRVASGFVPAIVGNVEKGVHPEFSEAYNALDSMAAKVPGLSANLPIRRDIFGEPVTTKGWKWSYLFNPFAISTESKDPVRREFARLNISTKEALNSMRTVDGIELSPQQYDFYLENMGQPLKEYLDTFVKSSTYENAPDDDWRAGGSPLKGTKQFMLKAIISNFKAQAKSKLYQEFPELLDKRRGNQESRIEQIFGQ